MRFPRSYCEPSQAPRILFEQPRRLKKNPKNLKKKKITPGFFGRVSFPKDCVLSSSGPGSGGERSPPCPRPPGWWQDARRVPGAAATGPVPSRPSYPCGHDRSSRASLIPPAVASSRG